MTYQVLARKWRPRNFDQVVGQTHVLRALINALDGDRLHHALLFTGTRGVGKTTLARILAKCLNCDQGVSATPCGVCSACQSIDAGRFVDLLEVDAASRTRVDDTRELLDNVQYAPTQGRFKVYLIDEVHMLSTHSFNALLKTLEEPPPHVQFLLATTDPQKLPPTILSRCLQFNLKRLPSALIAGQLQNICQHEGLTAEPEALDLLAQAAQGSLRDGLSLLDQAIAFGGGQVAQAQVRDMLGTVARQNIDALMQALATLDGAAALDAIAALDEQAPDYTHVLDELARRLQTVALAQWVPSRISEQMEAGAEQAVAAMSAEYVQLCYQIALVGKRDLALAPDPRLGFEMIVLRMLAFCPANDERATTVPAAPVSSAASPEPAPGAAPDAPTQSTSAAPSTPAAAAVNVSEHTATVDEYARPVPAQTVSPQVPEPSPARPPEQSPAQPPIQSSVQPQSRGTDTSTKTDFSSGGVAGNTPAAALTGTPNWSALIEALTLKGFSRELARHCTLDRVDDGTFYLQTDPAHYQLVTSAAQKRIADALSTHFGQTVGLRINKGEANSGTATMTPAQQLSQRDEQRYGQAQASVENDPNVQALKDTFDAELKPASIKPIN